MNKSMEEHETIPKDITISFVVPMSLKKTIDEILLEKTFLSRAELIRFCICNSIDKIREITIEGGLIFSEMKDSKKHKNMIKYPHVKINDVIYVSFDTGRKKQYERYQKTKRQLDGSNALVSEA